MSAAKVALAFVKLPDVKTKIKMLRIAFCDNDKPNYPISERRELLKIAKSGEAIKDIKQYINKIPSTGPDGKPVNMFGSTFVLDSIKNYLINDDKDELLFAIYKSAESLYTVKAKYPITPLMAFSLSISIIQDCH